MSDHDLDTFVNTAHAAADVAATVIKPFFRSSLSISDKNDASPVTIADRTAELAIRAVISERHPDHGIRGEEFGDKNSDARYCWVVDPIDGTRAFVTGRPTFGTLVALLRDGIPVIGIIDQPITGERWTGVSGRPSTFSGASNSVAMTRPCPVLGDAELSCTSPEMLESAPTPHWAALKQATKRVTWGGDCYSYGLLALGLIDVIAECDMKIWDWAALVPIIRGAGGDVTDWHGNDLHAKSDGTVLAVGDRSLTRVVSRLLIAGT